jgi:hypothetical protein
MVAEPEHRQKKRRWWRWGVVLAILLTVYVLSPPWIEISLLYVPTSAGNFLNATYKVVYYPFFALIDHNESLRGLYDSYYLWLIDRFPGIYQTLPRY